VKTLLNRCEDFVSGTHRGAVDSLMALRAAPILLLVVRNNTADARLKRLSSRWPV
jgi:hypothetical protein